LALIPKYECCLFLRQRYRFEIENCTSSEELLVLVCFNIP
jgi:hypothetical protein